MKRRNSYWNEFYEHNPVTEEPSTFAKFSLPYINTINTLIELGCGNGRDSVYFARNGINVVALDLSVKAIEINLKRKMVNIEFLNWDFTNSPSQIVKSRAIGSIYSRFTMHSIDKFSFEKTISWVANSLPVGSKFFIEARTINDALYGVGTPLNDNAFETSHYRRFLDIKDVKSRLEKLHFKFLYCVEDYVSAEYKNDGAVVLRMICEKEQ